MKLSSMVLAAVAGVVISSGSLFAATLAPVKGWVKLEEPVAVQFAEPAEGKAEDAKKALEAVGLKAAALPGMFVDAPATDVIGADGKPLFALYTFEGTKLDAVGAKVDGTKAVDLSAFYPQIKKGGTFILTWKDATPLVIETMYNPGRGKKELDAMVAAGRIPAAQREEAEKIFAPTVTRIVPLEYAVIKTEKGDVTATFDYSVAPNTVANFVQLAKEKYYDATSFHRIIKGFMVQGGDSLSNQEGREGSGGPGYQIMAEFSKKKHARGVLSMARSQDPNSAGSQFFMMHGTKEHLDGQYTAFGQITGGMDVVDKLAETPVSDDNGTVKGAKPKLISITILPATAEQYGIKK